MSTQRVAIVTGGARGIGAAVARRLGADGASVAVLDLLETETQAVVDEITAAGVKAMGLAVDVSDEDAVTAAVQRVAAELGPPTILVNNAGIVRDNLIFRMTAADWDSVMAVHLRGAFLMTRAVHAHQTEQHGGRTINMSSASALGNRGQANYAAAKAGLQGFTRTLAIELGPFGVTVNAVAPGFIESEMTAATAARVGVDFEAFKKAAVERSAVKRTGKPEDAAALVSFLASEDAGYVSGQIIYLAGGPRG